ncbi:MAG: Oar protein [Lysobacterales bacterium 14-68-21]|jgi:hypothetical protein|nr:MAG: Oar protein [Xanthomonadales bacterium 15-68-25]OZB66409.1 MAG: Oar protein [Xanthomonadales bacterium 14-68-21]
MSKRLFTRGSQPRRNALVIALAMGLVGAAGVANAQSTTGSIFGQAAPGDTVSVTSAATGLSRDVTVDSSGRYRVSSLPVGTYTVTLKKDGSVVDTRNGVSIAPNAGSAVNFDTSATNLSAVTVTGNALPAIDVSSVNSSTVITAADLQKLPVSRNAESIALLAPNTAPGSSYFGNAVAFGGSSVSENAYYVNGYTTGEPYKNIGGFQLPYGAIDQQETITGGYSAKYGRSDGGVINQIGKRGTNEWHFGAQVVWEPRYFEGNPKSTYYPHPTIPGPAGTTTYTIANPSLPGTIYQYRGDNKQWQTIYSAYVGGPLIKDKLYMFVAAETSKTQSTDVGTTAVATPTVAYNTDKKTKFYGKLDWNITDNNVLELTALKNNDSSGNGSFYTYNYNTFKSGSYVAGNNVSKDNAQFYIGHFTSYISDNATLSILYGKAKFQDPTSYGNRSPLPYISGVTVITPSKLPAGGISNDQTNRRWYSNSASNGTHGLRVDFDYRLGDHDLAVGIDNMYYQAKNQGPSQTNPFNPSIDYFWGYRANGTVRKYTIGWETSMSMAQKAFYLQDNWQVTSNLLLNIGLRNDHFTNYNDQGKPFVDEKNQWEPRIGASWDVNGDSSFKIYGNIGRYYLALPDNAAERAANISTYTWQTYTYTSVDANGIPQGLAPVGGLVSPDGEFGKPKDPQQVTARNLAPEYMDEFIAGFDKQLNDKWTYGAKAMWRDLKQAIDDECSPGQIAAKMTKLGLDPNNYSDSIYGPAYCRLINPGKTNTMLVRANAGSGASDVIVPMSRSDWGFTQGVKRKVGSVNLYLEHPFDGKWQARIDYTWSRGFGNTEGQVRSDFGQSDVSKTEDWDAWQLMEGQNGELFNIRKHSIRIRGAYQITPEWLVSGTLLAQSGVPLECLGYYGPNGDGDPVGYGPNYHWCAGKIVHPGYKHTPWTKPLNLGVHYTPEFADKKLAFNLDIFNVFNEQKATQVDITQDADVGYISNTFMMPTFYEAPRMVRLSVSYDY